MMAPGTNMDPIDFDLLRFQPKTLEEVIGDCLVVVDANVLLGLIVHRGVAAKELLKRLKELSGMDGGERRLYLPAQVIREFSQRAGDCVRDAMKEAGDAISRAQGLPASVTGAAGAIKAFAAKATLDEDLLRSDLAIDDERLAAIKGAVREYNEQLANLSTAADALDTGLEPFNDAARAVREQLKGAREGLMETFCPPWGLEGLLQVFESAHWCEFAEDELRAIPAEADERYAHGRPPGCLDSSKHSNRYGDYAIWKSILRIGANARRDLVFVTHERKTDWVQTVPENGGHRLVCARRELVEEYAAATGNLTFIIISAQQLLKEFVRRPVPTPVSDWDADISSFSCTTSTMAATGAAYPDYAPVSVIGTRVPEDNYDYLFIPGREYMRGHHVWRVRRAWSGQGDFSSEAFELEGPSGINWQKLDGADWNLTIILCGPETTPTSVGTVNFLEVHNRGKARGDIDVSELGRFRISVHGETPDARWRISVDEFVNQ